MTSEAFQSVLKLCEAESSQGWLQLPEGRQLTVHLSSAGVGLTISRITRLKVEPGRVEQGQLVQVVTLRDETYVFAVGDAFACAFEDTGPKAKGRKAGFV
ncbi:MAG TPA: hypothetical protein VHM70_17145 [Polyangiaceae bacterium]|jgi:hypothetical protein|nr:hypothetical protein [Polyangiaceae bacterium]